MVVQQQVPQDLIHKTITMATERLEIHFYTRYSKSEQLCHNLVIPCHKVKLFQPCDNLVISIWDIRDISEKSG